MSLVPRTSRGLVLVKGNHPAPQAAANKELWPSGEFAELQKEFEEGQIRFEEGQKKFRESFLKEEDISPN